MITLLSKIFNFTRLGTIVALVYLFIGGGFLFDAINCQPGQGGFFGCEFSIKIFLVYPLFLLLLPFGELYEKWGGYIENIFEYDYGSSRSLLHSKMAVYMLLNAVIFYFLGWAVEAIIRRLAQKIFRDSFQRIAAITKKFLLIILVLVILGGIAWISSYFIADFSSKQAASMMAEKRLNGRWTMVIQNDELCKDLSRPEYCNDSLEFDFLIVDGRKEFHSYLHHRPEYSDCEWRLKGKALTINCPLIGITKIYPEIVISDTDLILVDEEGNELVFERIPERF